MATIVNHTVTLLVVIPKWVTCEVLTRLNDAMAAFPLAFVRLWNHMGLTVEPHGFETSSSDIQKTQQPGLVVMLFIYSTMSTCDKKAVVFWTT